MVRLGICVAAWPQCHFLCVGAFKSTSFLAPDWFTEGGWSYHEGDAADPRMTVTGGHGRLHPYTTILCSGHTAAAPLHPYTARSF